MDSFSKKDYTPYYPYSVIPNVFLIGIVSTIKPEGTGMYIALIPLVYFAALLYHEKLGFIYPFSLSVVSGIIITVEVNVDFLMVLFLLTIGSIVLSVIVFLITFPMTLMSREADKYPFGAYSFGTGTLSLIIFLITFIVFNRYGL